MRGLNLKKEKYQPSLRPYSVTYFVENFTSYKEGNLKDVDLYLLNIKNLDFHQLMKLRIDLLDNYGLFFMRDDLFKEISYRIDYLVSGLIQKHKVRINTYDKHDLRAKREYFCSLIRKNTIELDEYKILKVRALAYERDRDTFESNFYTLNRVYNQVILHIDTYLITFETEENPNSEMVKIIMDRYNLPINKNKQKNNKKQIQSAPKQEVNKNTVTKEKLTPDKPIETIYAFFNWIRLQNKWFLIDEKHLYPFIYKHFDFGNSDYDDMNIPFVLKTDANKWGVMFYELKTNHFITQSGEKICNILSRYFCEFTTAKGTLKRVKKSPFTSAFENSDLREQHKLKKTNIPIDEIINKLR